MWSFIEINDTLQISKEQWFPSELNYEVHKNKPYNAADFKDKVFEFKGKDKIRIYKIPPVRNFLVENINWKWLYWWLIHIIEVKHDYVNWLTSWKFRIIHIYTPDEMQYTHRIIDRNIETDYLFAKK